jgi:hypothetical protein
MERGSLLPYCRAELHWYEAHGIGRKEFKRKRYLIKFMTTRKQSPRRFAICIENSEYPASLEKHKFYRVLPDKSAEREGDLRIVDESDEDYLYPADYFILVDFPANTGANDLQHTY